MKLLLDARRRVAHFCLLLTLLVCAPGVWAGYTLGVLQGRTATLTAQYWNPILNYIEQKSGVRIDLKVVRQPAELNQAIERGEFDFVASNAIFRPRASAVAYRPLFAAQGDETRWQLVTLATSPVKGLRDLQGGRVAVCRSCAPLDYTVPLEMLSRRGVAISVAAAETQEAALSRLKELDVIAVGVSSRAAAAFAERDPSALRILWESPAFPAEPVAAHARLPLSLVETLRAVVLEMGDNPDGVAILHSANRAARRHGQAGFRAVSDGDYQVYQEFFRKTLIKDSP